MRLPCLYLALLLLAAGWTSSAAAAPEAAEKPAADPLDGKLLDDLSDDLLDDLNADLKTQPKKPATAGEEPPAGMDPLDEQYLEDNPLIKQLLDELQGELPGGEDIGQQEQDPFVKIGNKMRTAGELIDGRDSAKKTQQLQQQIVSDLDKLIKDIKRRARQQSSSSSQNQQASSGRKTPRQPGQKPAGSARGQTAKQPARDSEDRVGKTKGKVDVEALTRLMKDRWGELPPKIREEMLQLPAEQFLPKYELQLEKYFKRLAEQQGNER